MLPVIFISPSFNYFEREKIAATLRIHNICSTTNKKEATVIIDKGNDMTIDELSGKIIADLSLKTADLKGLFNINESVLLQEQQKKENKKFIKNHAVQQYNKAKQLKKRLVVNRTKHK